MLPWVIGTPCFGLLMMWSLGLKARLNLLGCMLHSLCVVCPPAPSPCSVWYFKNITRMVVFGLVFSKNHLESSSWTSIFKESPGELYFCKEIWSTSVLFVNFWWCQPWVSKPGWIPRLACFITCPVHTLSPLVRYLLTSWQHFDRALLPTYLFKHLLNDIGQLF